MNKTDDTTDDMMSKARYEKARADTVMARCLKKQGAEGQVLEEARPGAEGRILEEARPGAEGKLLEEARPGAEGQVLEEARC